MDVTPDTPMPAATSDDDGGQPSTSGRGPEQQPSSSRAAAAAAAIQMCRVGWHMHMGQHEEAFNLTQQLLERDPYDLQCCLANSTAALLLGKKNDLFLR